MTMTNELRTAEAFLRKYFPAGGRMLCAVSGGLDSMCLLHFLTEQEGFQVTAAHFNHQLRGENADRDEAFVRDYCREKGIPFVSGRGDTRELAQREGMSVEEAARTLRYAFLTGAAEGFDAVCTAHHADDNAETMLLHLLRGTGSKGLAGIPPVRGKVYRPFLEVSRRELEAYARAHGIPHIEDETNRTDDAARNVLRHQVLPVFTELNAKAVENMSRAARLLREDADTLECLAADAAAQAVSTERGVVISAAALSGGDAVAGRAVLQLLEKMAGHRKDLTAAHVEAVLRLQPGGQLSLPYGITVSRTAQEVRMERMETLPEEHTIQMGETVSLGDWTVCLQSGEGNLSLPQNAEVRVTRWRRDDRMTLPGSKGSRSFKRLCAERGITPMQRDALPVLRVNGHIAAVPQIGVDSSFAPGANPVPARIEFINKTGERNHEK